MLWPLVPFDNICSTWSSHKLEGMRDVLETCVPKVNPDTDDGGVETEQTIVCSGWSYTVDDAGLLFVHQNCITCLVGSQCIKRATM